MNHLIAFLEEELETRMRSFSPSDEAFGDERYINEARQALAEAVKVKKLMEDLRKQVMHHAALHGRAVKLLKQADEVLR